MLTENIYLIIYIGATTIDGKYLIPKGIETVSWYWNADEGKIHTNKLNNVMYFSESLVNMISETALTVSIKDDERTWLLKRSKYSIFTWGFGKHKRTIAH